MIAVLAAFCMFAALLKVIIQATYSALKAIAPKTTILGIDR